jgi:hypothetical protein
MSLWFLALLVVVFPVQAEVFKCTINAYKIIYQATPCSSKNAEQKVDIKPRSAEQEVAAAQALKKWEAKYSAQQAAEKRALIADKDKQPRNIIIKVIQRPLPQLRVRKITKRRMLKLP